MSTLPSTDDGQAESPSAHFTVCPIYEVFYEYLRVVNRPLTGLEQRAFLPLLDLDADERGIHSEVDGECVCMDLLPKIVQALEPDPVDCDVSERSLEGESYAAQRWHTEKIGKFQGIVLDRKTRREHADELRERGKGLLDDFDAILRELTRRMALLGHTSEAELIRTEFPRIVELTVIASKRKRRQSPAVVSAQTSAPTWAVLRGQISAEHATELERLQEVARMLARWNIS